MRKLEIVAITMLVSGVLGSASAQTITYTVDCAKGQTIAGAIARGDDRKPLVVNVRGTCNEFVSIKRDNVTLHGDPAASIHAPNNDADLIYIGANGVLLENLTLTGGYHGVRVDGAFRTIVSNCVIQDPRMDGVRVFVGDVRVSNSTIQRAGGSGAYLTRGGSLGTSNSRYLDNVNSGIYATGNATVSASNSTIRGNGSNGVQLDNASQGSFGGSTISGNGTDSGKGGSGISVATGQVSVGNNAITSNRTDGVLVLAGANAWIDNNTITGNGSNGVFGYLGTTLVLHGNVISGNSQSGVACRAHCTLQVGGATIQNNASEGIVVMLGSKLILEAPTTQSMGNGGWGLWCGDKESSVDGVDSLSVDGGDFFDGSVSPTCTGYDD